MINKLGQRESSGIREASVYTNKYTGASQAGFTLLELMISLGLGIAISWVVLDIALTGVRNNQDVITSGEVTENGRYLSDVLVHELNHAGFYGQSQTINPTGSPARDMCAGATLSTNDLLYPIDGRNDVDGSPVCGINDILPGSDVLMIRRASTGAEIKLDKLEGAQHYVQSNMDQAVLGTGASKDTDFILTNMTGTTAAPIREFYEDIYYVDTSGNFNRSHLVGGSYVTEPLAEGVDDFQVQYHIDTNDEHFADIVREIPDGYDEWKHVMSVSTFLLMKSTTSSHQTDDKSYSYAGKTNVSYNDSRKRRLFTSVAALNLRDPITITTAAIDIDNFSFENDVTGKWNEKIAGWDIITTPPKYAGTLNKNGEGLIVSNFLDSHGAWIWYGPSNRIESETDENYDENSVYEFQVNIGDTSWTGKDYKGPGAYRIAIKVGATELAAVSGNIPDEDTLKLAMVSSKDFPASSTLTGKIKFIIENTGDIEILADYVRGSKTTTITN